MEKKRNLSSICTLLLHVNQWKWINKLFFVTEQAKSVLLECQGAEKIVKKLGDLEKNFDEKSDNRIELAACGSLLNVASDDGKVLCVFFLVVAGQSCVRC